LNEDGPEIIDVGPGWSGDQQGAECLEQRVTIIALKEGHRVKTEATGPLQSVRSYDRTSTFY